MLRWMFKAAGDRLFWGGWPHLLGVILFTIVLLSEAGSEGGAVISTTMIAFVPLSLLLAHTLATGLPMARQARRNALPVVEARWLGLWYLTWALLPLALLSTALVEPSTSLQGYVCFLAMYSVLMGSAATGAPFTWVIVPSLFPIGTSSNPDSVWKWGIVASVVVLGCMILRSSWPLRRHRSSPHAVRPPIPTHKGADWRGATNPWSRLMVVFRLIPNGNRFWVPITLGAGAALLASLISDPDRREFQQFVIVLLSGFFMVATTHGTDTLSHALAAARERRWLCTVPGLPSRSTQQALLRKRYLRDALSLSLAGLMALGGLSHLLGVKIGLRLALPFAIIGLWLTRSRDRDLQRLSDDPSASERSHLGLIFGVPTLLFCWGIAALLGLDWLVMSVLLLGTLIEMRLWLRARPHGYSLSWVPDAHPERRDATTPWP